MFPEHYSTTAIAVLSIPGWHITLQDGAEDVDYWIHDNGTIATVNPDGTISTYPLS